MLRPLKWPLTDQAILTHAQLSGTSGSVGAAPLPAALLSFQVDGGDPQRHQLGLACPRSESQGASCVLTAVAASLGDGDFLLA